MIDLFYFFDKLSSRSTPAFFNYTKEKNYNYFTLPTKVRFSGILNAKLILFYIMIWKN